MRNGSLSGLLFFPVRNIARGKDIGVIADLKELVDYNESHGVEVLGKVFAHELRVGSNARAPKHFLRSNLLFAVLQYKPALVIALHDLLFEYHFDTVITQPLQGRFTGLFVGPF